MEENKVSDELWCLWNVLEYYNKKGGEDGVHYYTLKYMYENDTQHRMVQNKILLSSSIPINHVPAIMLIYSAIYDPKCSGIFDCFNREWLHDLFDGFSGVYPDYEKLEAYDIYEWIRVFDYYNAQYKCNIVAHKQKPEIIGLIKTPQIVFRIKDMLEMCTLNM